MSERLQATVADTWMAQVRELEEETGLSTSQLVAEALSVFCTAAREARAGRRLAFLLGDDVKEFLTPTLAQLELSENARLTLANEDFDRLTQQLKKPPKANAELRKLMRKRQ